MAFVEYQQQLHDSFEQDQSPSYDDTKLSIGDSKKYTSKLKKYLSAKDRIRQGDICCICLDENDNSSIFLPCCKYKNAVCEECIFNLFQIKGKSCPVCRSDIIDAMNIFAGKQHSEREKLLPPILYNKPNRYVSEHNDAFNNALNNEITVKKTNLEKINIELNNHPGCIIMGSNNEGSIDIKLEKHPYLYITLPNYIVQNGNVKHLFKLLDSMKKNINKLKNHNECKKYIDKLKSVLANLNTENKITLSNQAINYSEGVVFVKNINKKQDEKKILKYIKELYWYVNN